MGFGRSNIEDEPEEYYNVDSAADKDSDGPVHVSFESGAFNDRFEDQHSTASTTETETNSEAEEAKTKRLRVILIVLAVVIVVVILIVVATFLSLYFVRGKLD